MKPNIHLQPRRHLAAVAALAVATLVLASAFFAGSRWEAGRRQKTPLPKVNVMAR